MGQHTINLLVGEPFRVPVVNFKVNVWIQKVQSDIEL